MHSRSALRAGCFAALAAYAIGVGSALAQTRDIEPRLAVRVGAASTDNLGRVRDEDAQSETFATTGIDIGFLRETPRARAYADGTIDYYAYNSDQFSNETAGSIDGGLAIHIVPDTFSWDLNERIDHARIDPFTPAGPGNSERVNLFSTGPRFARQLGESSSIGLSAQHTDRRYRERETLDGPTRSANLELGHDLSDLDRLAFVVSAQDIEFDGTAVPYDIRDTYLTYERRAASEGRFAISGGSSRLRREGESTSEPYFQLEWARDITPRSAIGFGGGRRFESPTDYLDSSSFSGYAAGGLEDTLLTPEPRTTTDARLTYTLVRPRATFRAGQERVKEEYEDSSRSERDVLRSSVGADYRFTPLLVGAIQVVRAREDFELGGTATEDRTVASIRRRLGRAWEGSLSFEASTYEREFGDSSDERRYILSLLWSPVRRQTTR